MSNKAVFTTFEAARMCHVSPLSIINWVNAGRLAAFRTPGGHRRIRREDLLSFMRDSGLPLPDELRDGARRRALIAEEDRATREMLVRHLTSLARPFEVATATSPFDLGRLVGSLRPEVVVLDVRMPGLDAAQACRSIRSDAASAATVVIATVGPGFPDAEKRLLEGGVARCFPRPLDVGALASFIESALAEPSRPTTRRRRTARG